MKRHIVFYRNPPENPRQYHYDDSREAKIALLWVAFFVIAVLIGTFGDRLLIWLGWWK